MKAFYIAISAASMLLTAACGGVSVETESLSAPLSVATTPTTPAIPNQSGSPQPRDCLHCAP